VTGNGRRPLVALATSADWPELAPDDRLIAPALARAGVESRIAIWNDPTVAWKQFDLIVIRSCWDYHDDLSRWLAWIDVVGARGANARLRNPAPVLHWNARKTYLRELGARGVPVVPTIWLGDAELSSWTAVKTALQAAPWDDVVLKPAVSAGALGTFRVQRQALSSSEVALTEALFEWKRRAPVLVQPYLADIGIGGEWSLLFFGGRMSHAVLKRPAPGDFRVQERHGGSTFSAVAPEGLVHVAARAIAAVSEAMGASSITPGPGASSLLYARVDLVVSDGAPLLIELELIEPALFLATDVGAADRFAAAVLAQVT
jgi:glutathione synthase/RimK-type ligase-like ATP-grasp enzyme